MTLHVSAADPATPTPPAAVQSNAKPATEPANPTATATAAKEGKCDMAGGGCCGDKAKHGRKSKKMKKADETKAS